jgi:hypothetical protein
MHQVGSSRNSCEVSFSGLPSMSALEAFVSSRSGPQVSSDEACPGGAADQRPHARQHLLDVERLGHIVVGAGVDAGHLVAPAVARGQHQHRHLAALATPFLHTLMPSICGRPMSSTTAS